MSLPLNEVILGDCVEVMQGWAAGSIDLVVTSPPYWGLRDYGAETVRVWDGELECEHEWTEITKHRSAGGPQVPQSINPRNISVVLAQRDNISNFCYKCGAWRGSLGLEPHPQMFIDHLVEICREIKRVLKPSGTFWLNLGDTYYGSHAGKIPQAKNPNVKIPEPPSSIAKGNWLQPKQLLGIPWRVAVALQDDGWILRNDIIWYKPNHMPSSVRDRLTNAYERVFLLAKEPRYYFDLNAIRQPHAQPDALTKKAGSITRGGQPRQSPETSGYELKSNPLGKNPGDLWTVEEEKLTKHDIAVGRTGNFSYTDPLHTKEYHPKGKNPGDLWRIPTTPFSGAHFAVFPIKLIEPIIKAGCPKGGIVLDPFAGSGTSLRVARRLGRSFIGVEINPEYVELCLKRVKADRYRKPPEGVNPLSDYIDLHQANQKEEKEDV